MKKIFRRLENLMMAIAFAEAGEHETARQIMKDEKRTGKRERVRPPQRPEREMRA